MTPENYFDKSEFANDVILFDKDGKHFTYNDMLKFAQSYSNYVQEQSTKVDKVCSNCAYFESATCANCWNNNKWLKKQKRCKNTTKNNQLTP